MLYRYTLCIALFVALGTFVALQVNSEPGPAERTYVGQESCMEAGCHADAYGPGSDYQGAAAFRETMHQKIHLRPTPETVIIDEWFDRDTVLRAYDHRVKVPGRDTLLIYLSKRPGGTGYWSKMEFSGGGDTTGWMPIEYTYGGNGWIQRFLVKIDGGFYTLPFQFLLPRYKDRSLAGSELRFLDDSKWFTVDGTTFEAHFHEFKSQKFLDQSWDKNCTQCHVNGFDLKKVITPEGNTQWVSQWVGKDMGDSALMDQNIKIGCESCHGPGSEHVENPTVENIVAPSTWPRTFAGTDLKLDLCNQCHNRIASTAGLHNYAYDDTNMRPYIPGQPLKNFIKSEFGNMTVWGDNLTSKAHHQTGQDYARSVEYEKHIFKNGCYSCHVVHQEGPDDLPFQLDRDWYSLKSGEGCLAAGCHETFGDTVMSPVVGRMVNKHTQHTNSISQCVNCHFTKTATISFGQLPTKPLHEFTLHNFKVLRPKLTRQFRNLGEVGMLNTCAEGCHRNGRGSRNFFETDPIAPDYGIKDNILTLWKESTDIALADSLEFHWNRLFPASVKESNERGSSLTIVSIQPNPSRGETKLRFSVPKPMNIDLEIYDIQGRYINTLAGGRHEPGTYSENWNGTDEMGVRVPNGVYIVRLTAGSKTVTDKVILQR